MATTDNPVLRANERAKQRTQVELPSEVTQVFDAAKAVQQSVVSQQQKILKETEQQEKQVTRDLDAKARNEQIQLSVQRAAELQIQNETTKAAREVGAQEDLTETRKMMNHFQDQYRRDVKDLEQLSREAPTGVGLFDNWFNGVRARKLKDSISNSRQRIAELSRDVIEKTAVIKEAHTAATLVAEKVNSASIAAEQDNIILNASIAKAKVGAEFNATQAKQLAALSNATQDGVNIVLREQQMRAELLRTDNEASNAEVLRRRLAEMDSEQAKKDLFVNTINNHRAKLGKGAIDKDALLIDYEFYIRGAFDKMMEGNKSAFVNGQLGKYSDTPAEAVDAYRMSGAVPNQYLAPILEEASNAVTGAERLDQFVATKIAKMDAAIESGDANNIFASPGSDAVAVNPQVVNSPLWQKVVATTGAEIAEHNGFIAAGVAAVESGELTASEFIDGVKLIYSESRAISNALVQTESIGVPAGNSYNARVRMPRLPASKLGILGNITPLAIASTTDVPMGGLALSVGKSIIGGSETYDLTDSADLGRMLIRYRIIHRLGGAKSANSL